LGKRFGRTLSRTGAGRSSSRRRILPTTRSNDEVRDADLRPRPQPRETAKAVRVGANGRPVITHGPYLELKEVIGGLVL
jgi:hypothetical protein